MAEIKHQRDAATPLEGGVFLVDCTCGAEYYVPQGGDEYANLETANERHAKGLCLHCGADHRGEDGSLTPCVESIIETLVARPYLYPDD